MAHLCRRSRNAGGSVSGCADQHPGRAALRSGIRTGQRGITPWRVLLLLLVGPPGAFTTPRVADAAGHAELPSGRDGGAWPNRSVPVPSVVRGGKASFLRGLRRSVHGRRAPSRGSTLPRANGRRCGSVPRSPGAEHGAGVRGGWDVPAGADLRDAAAERMWNPGLSRVRRRQR